MLQNNIEAFVVTTWQFEGPVQGLAYSILLHVTDDSKSCFSATSAAMHSQSDRSIASILQAVKVAGLKLYLSYSVIASRI